MAASRPLPRDPYRHNAMERRAPPPRYRFRCWLFGHDWACLGACRRCQQAAPTNVDPHRDGFHHWTPEVAVEDICQMRMVCQDCPAKKVYDGNHHGDWIEGTLKCQRCGSTTYAVDDGWTD